MGAPRFEDVIGQRHAVQTLRGVLRADRVHHAWLFHGPEGVGKRLAARAFAGVLLDPSAAVDLAGEVSADPASPAQRLLAADTHPDLRLITKELASVSRKDTVRDQKQRNIALEVLKEFLTEPATRGGVASVGARARRVFIVDEAHLIAREGHGALLKTLEEPAPGVVIILLTDHESDLPATIRSRCQRLAFGTLGDEDMARWAARSAPEMPAERREWLLTHAGGSPGRVMDWHEAGAPEWASRLAPALEGLERGRYAPEFQAEIKTILSESAEAWVNAHGDNASKEAANRASASRLFALLGERFRGRLREQASGGGGGAARALRDIDLLARAESMLDGNANADFVFDNLAAQTSRA